ncbi:uncharacterized protein LOC120172275 [Hibiscus syriacus]|uniref:uncharacterized protein LOC120172275 n=1 Tax=Hibiscus syriacus TaxID=106335 RepID=UPI0019226B52|nr:uncharacterized protein LOC120172275 [Hibiscus syriacus]
MWEWITECYKAFENMKEAMVSALDLVLPDYTKFFEVYTDASGVSIGGVLIQEGHLIAYESQKFNETERKYSVHDNEMIVVVYCLWTWQNFFLVPVGLPHTDGLSNIMVVVDMFSKYSKFILTSKGLPESEGSWEHAKGLWQFKPEIDQYHTKRVMRASLDPVGKNVTECEPMTEVTMKEDA